MRLVCISDTHNLCEDVFIPDGDVLVHAGDLTGRGSLNEIQQAAAWLRSLPHKHKVVIAGNHDFCFQTKPEQARGLMHGLHYLQDQSMTIDGVKFYGSPWQPWFHDWAFNLKRGKELQEKWALIPPDTDVLVTHGPLFGHLDLVPRDGERVGCHDLLEAVLRVQPKVHVAGHIHEGYGEDQLGTTKLVNASICDGRYRPVNKPIIVEV